MDYLVNKFLLGLFFFGVSLQALANNEVKFRSHDINLSGAKDHKLIKRFPGAVIFDYSHKQSNEYELILGDIKHVESEDPEKSGYRASHAELIKGEMTRIVYDYPITATISSILDNMQNNLKKKGFKQVYSCNQTMCGAAVGWKTFLYENVGSDDLGQHYFVANFDKITVAFYINELAGQPRAVLDIVDFSKNSNIELEGIDGESVAIIYFDSDKSDVKDKKNQKISDLMMVSLKEQRTFIVKGYTDPSGDDEKNNLLSTKRAEEVKKYLNQYYSIPLDKINAIGLGVAESKKVESINEKASQRRVEISLKTNS